MNMLQKYTVKAVIYGHCFGWLSRCIVGPFSEVYLLYNFLHLMFLLPLLCNVTYILRPFSVEKTSGIIK